MAYRSPSSTSTAASPSSNNTYHVFISHRGPDVKKTLASHLYHRLCSAQRLRVFLDKPELRVGDDFPFQIKEAIRTASVHLAIFSPGYAASEWCLNELLYMLESGAPIIPVFYHVQPADLRRTQSKGGVYSKALCKMEWKKTYDSDTMEEKARYDPATIQKWREALSTVASISGLDLQETCNGDEGELVERIVELVLQKVKKPALSHLTRYPVGLNEEVEIFEKQVLKNQQSGKAQVVGIVGIGGAGKTTLAVELYNRKSSNYDKFYFLHDVGAGKSSLPSLQRKLLKGLTDLDLPVDNIYEGTQMLRQYLSSSDSKLLVLDNVDDRNQVYALLPDLENVLSSSSFVLITCRDTDVLTMSGVKKSSIYDLNGLNPQYSLELFCLHAFSQPYPPPEFKDLVDKFLTACCGLPLSLEVFGALLYGENDITCWDAHFDRLRKKLPNNIQERLQISYDASNNIQERLQTSYGASNNIQESLQISYDALDKEDRQIFLDITCFFVGEDRDMAVSIWDGSGWNGLLGFQNLQNRCLVQVDSENKIKMHEHLRDLGKAIAQTSGSRHCIRPSTDTIDELLQQTSVRAEVRGIRMHPSEYKDNVDLNLPIEYKDGDDEDPSISSYKMRKLQLLDIEDGLLERILRRMHAPNLIWLRWEKCPCSSLPSWILMENLRVLEVHGNELETLWQSENQAPSQLRELKIRDAPLSKFPESIGKLMHLEKIYVNLKGGKINFETLPAEFCNLESLMSLELLNCSEMRSLPELFGNLTNLRHIDLKNCRKLRRLPNSFGNLTSLKYLNLYSCSNLTISSETLGNIRTLENINLSYCNKIEQIPPQIALQLSLEKFYCSNANFKDLPSAIGGLSKLEVLHLGSTMLKALPDSLGDLRNLKQLILVGCHSLKCLPESVGLLSQLIKLRLDCPIRELPFKRQVNSSIDNCTFPQLQRIDLLNAEVSEVSFGQGVCPNLQYLMVHDCNALTKVGTLPNTLIKLELRLCQQLASIEEGLCGLAKLEVLFVSDCPNLESIWGLEKLTKLRLVALLSRDRIRELPSVKDLRLLEKLMVPRRAMKSIQGLEQLTNLRELDVSGCCDLKELPGVEHLGSLEKLNASDCGKLKNIRLSHQQTKLQGLDVTRCYDLEVLQGVEHLRSLEELKASFCKRLKRIQVSEQLTKLRKIDVTRCSDLEELPGVKHLKSLEELKASFCARLKSIQVSDQLAKLRELDVTGCSDLDVLGGVEYLRSLKNLKASGCRKLKSIQASEQLTDLREVDVSGCSSLEALSGIEHLRSMKELKAYGCRKLKSIQLSEQLTQLRTLDISGCSDLEGLPGFEHLRSLWKLKASGCGKLKSIQGSELVTEVRELGVSECFDLEELPWIELLRSLEKLNASGCGKWKWIQGLENLTKLRELYVTGCLELEKLQGLEHLVSLEMLMVSGCKKLKSIQVSKQWTKLRELHLSGCFELGELSVGHLRSLEKLNISRGSNLEELPLKTLDTSGCAKLKTIWSSCELTKLRKLDVSGCSWLEELGSVGHLGSLEKLNASGCGKLKIIRLSGLFMLRELDVSGCSNLEKLPGIEDSRSLKRLILETAGIKCSRLLEKLKASDCGKLKIIHMSEYLRNLRELDVSGCSGLEELLGVEHLRSLEKLNASGCGKLKWIQGLENLTKLRELYVTGCLELEKLQGLEHLVSLEMLMVSGCKKLKSIQVSKQWTKLRELHLSGCFELGELSVGHLRSLEKLNISRGSNLEELPLETLNTSGCTKLKTIWSSCELTKLRKLDVSGCSWLEELGSVGHLGSLEKLNASGCGELKIIHLSGLFMLRELDVSGCSNLEKLPGMEDSRSLERLKKLKASDCGKLKIIHMSEYLRNLREPDVSGCSGLEELLDVEHLRSLEQLNASGCRKLKRIRGLVQLTELRDLDITGCFGLVELHVLDTSFGLRS